MTYVIPLRMRSQAPDIDQNAELVIQRLRNYCLPSAFSEPIEYCDPISIANPETASFNGLSQEVVAKAEGHAALGHDIFIDVGGPTFDEVVSPKVASALAEAVTAFGLRKPATKVVILMQRQYLDDDVFFNILETQCVKHGGIIVFADCGSIFNADGDGQRTSKVATMIIQWCELTRTSNKKNLVQKLIRHRGFYAAPVGGTTVSMFDGRNCVGEITELILERLAEWFPDESPVNILVDDKNSYWFGEAVYNATSQLRSNVSFFFTREGIATPPTSGFDAVLFSVIRSGTSARKLLTDKALGIKSGAKLWSLISLENNVKSTEHHYSKTFDLNPGSVEIMVEIGQDSREDELLESFWKKSNVKPHPIGEIALHEKFRSDEMWSLLLESGIMPEVDVPGSRVGFDWVPDMDAFVEMHGPLLAGKISASLARSNGSNSTEGTFFFVHPGDRIATKLVEYVCTLTRKRSIKVDRGILHLAESSKNIADLRRRASTDELQKHIDVLERVAGTERLSTINLGSKPVKVVLIDEFSGGGDTLFQLRKLCQLLDWDIRSVICPVVVGPKTPKNEFIEHSYYDFGIPLHEH